MSRLIKLKTEIREFHVMQNNCFAIKLVQPFRHFRHRIVPQPGAQRYPKTVRMGDKTIRKKKYITRSSWKN